MNGIRLCIGLFCITALVAGKENVVSQPVAICGVVMDDPYPMKRMSMPVADARVELRTQVYTIQGTTDVLPVMGILVDSAITDTYGKFCLKNEAKAAYNVIVTHPDYTTKQISLSASVDTNLNIALLNKDAVSFISGTVSAGCSNLTQICSPSPVPECSVSVSLSSYAITGFAPVKGITISAVTDAKGHYLLKNIPLSYNGEQVDVYATKSGTSRIVVAAVKNTDTTVVNFANFPPDFAADSLFQVSPSKPTSKDSILIRFYNANDCCCAVYRDMTISVIDSIIYINYSLDSSPCSACNCIGNGKWAGVQSKPLNPGKYYVYKNSSFYCPPGAMCPLYMMPPVLLGTLVVSKPTDVITSNMKIKSQDSFTFTLAGSSVTVDLVKSSRVILKAFSVNGALLGELYNGSLSAGSNNISINNLDRIVPANSMVILNMTVNGVTKAVKRVTAAGR